MWNILIISITGFTYTRFAEGQADGILRLMNGSHSKEGRLEIFHSGIWGSVCDDSFGQTDAIVACRQLGFRCLSNVQVYTEGGFTTSKIWMDNVSCNGQESYLKSCSFGGWGKHDCSTGENVGIRCYGGCAGDLWLVGGNIEGRLHIYHSGSWGTICDDSFGSQEALVVCKQLLLWTQNYRTTIVQFYTTGHGNGTIWLDDVACNGNENRIADCAHRGWNVHNYGHSEDVSVRCYGSYSSDEVDGHWGSWSSWTSCSSTCGSGTRKGTRRCDNPFPMFGGSTCCGRSEESRTCTGSSCPVDGDWSNWSQWSRCTASCNGGIQERARTCDAPTPSYGGRCCIGHTTESQSCNNVHCQINGQWGDWLEWESCNETCGNGFEQRSRKCDSPFPMFGGSECIGFDFDIQNCSQNICPGVKLQLKNVKIPPTFSREVLGGVAAGCIVATAVIIVIALFVFRRFRCEQNAKRKKSETNTARDGESRDTSQHSNYEFIEPSNGVNGEHESYTVTRSGHDNSQFSGCNDVLYENMRI